MTAPSTDDTQPQIPERLAKQHRPLRRPPLGQLGRPHSHDAALRGHEGGVPPHALLLYRVGDFFETFFQDAITIARELELVLTSKDGR